MCKNVSHISNLRIIVKFTREQKGTSTILPVEDVKATPWSWSYGNMPLQKLINPSIGRSRRMVFHHMVFLILPKQ